MFDTSTLSRGWTLPFQQLTESQNGIQRSAQLVTHAREKLALRLVRAVGFITRQLQRLFHLGTLSHIVGNSEKGFRTIRPGRRPENINTRAIFANVAVHKIGYFSRLLQRSLSRER